MYFEGHLESDLMVIYILDRLNKELTEQSATAKCKLCHCGKDVIYSSESGLASQAASHGNFHDSIPVKPGCQIHMPLQAR